MKEITVQKGFQENAVDCPADIAIIGGSAGCGKTFCLLFDPLEYVLDPVEGFTGIIFRRDSVQIKATGGLWSQAKDLYRQLPDGFRPQSYGGNTHFKFLFPSGFDLQLAHLHDEDSVYGYQGTQLAYIAFDELTHFTEEQFFYMLSRNRSTCDVIPYVRASTNPQGEGWVKRLISWWIYPDDYEIEILSGAPIPERQGVLRYMARLDNKVLMGATPEEVIAMLPEPMREKFPPETIRSITFVAGKLSENHVLMESNPGYLGNLLGLSESERAQLLDGRWVTLDADSSRLYQNAAISDIFSNTFVPRTGVRYITADIALEGVDKFVIIVWDGWVIVDIQTFDKSMGDEVLRHIENAARIWSVPVRNICFDSGGVGGYLKGFLKTAYPFVSGAAPLIEQTTSLIHGKKNDAPQYYNLRSQCFFLLRDKVENCEIYSEVDDHHRLPIEQELRAIKKVEGQADKKLRVISTDQIKRILGRSPDYAAAISMRPVFDLKRDITPTRRKVTSIR